MPTVMPTGASQGDICWIRRCVARAQLAEKTRDLQDYAAERGGLRKPSGATRNEQVSGSSPLVGSGFSGFAG
jgi:hypothetical protein